jgi:hypothetical protein
VRIKCFIAERSASMAREINRVDDKVLLQPIME